MKWTRMKYFRWLTILFFAFTGMACQGDDGVALLSSLFNQRITVILKGTYATNRPLTRAQINNNKLFVDIDDQTASLKHAVDTGCIPFIDPACIPSYSKLPIWIDIGELRLSDRSSFSDLSEIKSSEDAKKFWDVLSNERQVYCSIPYAIDFDNACIQTGGIINFQEFINGRGAVYPSRDVQSDNYVHSGIYVRAFATGYGLIGGAFSQDHFDNQTILGANIIRNLQYDPNLDDLSIQELAPQWFPLHHKVVWGQPAIVLDHGESPAIIEYRFNMLENLMVHSVVNSTLNVDQVVVAFSDWRREHDDDIGSHNHLGGNVLARTRLFYPHMTNTMLIGGGAGSTRHYYSLYMANEDSKQDNLPLAATPVRNGADNELKYIMPGDYILECKYDCNNDGYPELTLKTSGTIPVGQGPGNVSVNFPCGCGIDTPTVSANSCVTHTGCY